MAKKVTGYIKLQIPAGKATPAPPVGPALGQHGVNIVEFTKQFNAKTADKGDLIIPVVITVYADRSFSFIHCVAVFTNGNSFQQVAIEYDTAVVVLSEYHLLAVAEVDGAVGTNIFIGNV